MAPDPEEFKAMSKKVAATYKVVVQIATKLKYIERDVARAQESADTAHDRITKTASSPSPWLEYGWRVIIAFVAIMALILSLAK